MLIDNVSVGLMNWIHTFVGMRVCHKACPLLFLGTDYTDYTDFFMRL